jgi:hypothetical protein
VTAVHSAAAVAEVLALRALGFGARRIAARTGLPVSTVTDWLAGRVPQRHSGERAAGEKKCEQCGHDAHAIADLPPEYVYLLGIYLGDGCISEHARQVFRLRLFLDLRYPLIIDECEAAIRSVAPRSKVHRMFRRSHYIERSDPSHVELSAFSKLWPCLLPQHGPGRKHARPIVLTNWQRALVQRHAGKLLRGLIHSDGCRFINTGRDWICPRYAFSNKSSDIRRIFCDACDLLGLRYTFAKETVVYVSHRADVEAMDSFVGPKR